MNFVPMAVTAPDHPRSRGVYNAKLKRALTRIGSSPLARGLPHPPGGSEPAAGIIPARAGFTWRMRPTSSKRKDHPRSRGVYGL